LTLRIRRATDDDREGVHMVHVRAIREVCSRSYSASQIAAWACLLSPDSYVAVVREGFLVVAEGADGIAGFGQLDQKSGEVEAVYVLPGLQGKGIGGALLRSLEDAARAAGLKKLHLSATLNAVSFYERSGYVGEGPIVHRLATGVELQCLRMSKELEPS
jgi:putative acetyltransferase